MKLVISILSLFLFLTATAQPQFTDSSFGSNGKMVENTSVPSVDIIDALLQPDGKTLMLATSYYNAINRTILIRYNTDGSADNSFSSDGIADSLVTPGVDCNPKAMRLQADGKILVVCDTGDYYKKGMIARYNANGSFDNSFGMNGILYLPSFTINGTFFTLPGVDDLALSSNNTITLLCTRSYPNADFALVRLNSNGTIDNSFGTNGCAIADPLSNISSNKSPRYTHIEVLANGKYIIGGSPGIYNSTGGTEGSLVSRINADGRVDNSFGINGYILPSGVSDIGKLQDMIVQPDGKIIASGPKNSYGFRTYTSVLRLTAAGVPDVTFGNGGGKQTIYAAATGFTTIEPRINLQADGKVLLGGIAKNSDGNYTIAVARLTITGALDASFDSDGIALLQVNNHNSYGRIALQQTDGRIVVTGYACNNTIQSTTIGRFTANGQTDNTLNAGANITLLNNGPDNESGINLLVQPADQKMVTVRERSNGFNYDLCVSRHLPNGQPDNSFGTNGKTFLDLPGEYYEVYSGLSNNGNITVIPDFTDYTTFATLAIFRLLANGKMDSSFGVHGKKIFKSRNTDTITTSLQRAIVLPNGKIVMSIHQNEGVLDQYYGRDSNFIIRLNPDGTFDNSFNGSGKKYLPDSTNSYKGMNTVQPDGKILLSRSTLLYDGTNYEWKSFISRLNVDGSLDGTFNNGIEKQINSQTGEITPLLDGKMLIFNYQSSILRLTSNGNVDSSFGVSGYVDISGYYPDNGNGSTYVSNIKVDSNRIVLAGRYYDTIIRSYVFKTVALKNNGIIDSSFGQSGVIISDVFNDGNGEQIALQADQKVVITGFRDNQNASNVVDFALTRLKANNLTTGRRYTFTGSGLWSNPANWADGTVPPTTIPAGSSIVIDPPASGECVVDIPVRVQSGASVTIKAGKKVRLPGNLIIQ